MRHRLFTLFALPFALGLVAAACSKGSTPAAGGGATSSEKKANTITIGSDKANNHGSKDVSGLSETSVELDDFYFEPTVLQGKPGQKLKLELENEGAALHNFTLEEQSIDQDVAAGQKADVTVTIPQSGTIEFFCKYHKSSAMVGGLAAV
jgi:plastocyanin